MIQHPDWLFGYGTLVDAATENVSKCSVYNRVEISAPSRRPRPATPAWNKWRMIPSGTPVQRLACAYAGEATPDQVRSHLTAAFSSTPLWLEVIVEALPLTLWGKNPLHRPAITLYTLVSAHKLQINISFSNLFRRRGGRGIRGVGDVNTHDIFRKTPASSAGRFLCRRPAQSTRCSTSVETDSAQ